MMGLNFCLSLDLEKSQTNGSEKALVSHFIIMNAQRWADILVRDETCLIKKSFMAVNYLLRTRAAQK